ESRFCFNIDITEKTDPRGKQGEFSSDDFDCFPFIRSAATLECNADNTLADLRNREQLNLLTAYVDGSNIYGSEQTEADELRVHDGHLRATSDGPIHAELPVATTAGEGEEACNNDGDDSFPCHLAGDFRVDEQPGLASMHTLWVREHNRVAAGLVQNNGYQDDTVASSNELYHATRRIVIAEYQNIVYDGYLRSFMDAKIFDDFKLNSCTDGSCSYDDSLNPSITNEWGIANRFIETDVTENLFRSDARNAFDLASLNIQRGRDHGVSYCATRKALGLKVPATFQEAETMQLFSTETIALLENIYDCICDIDLFTAIVAERPLRTRTNLPDRSESPIAETLNYIQADMYKKQKLGDRFWFEFERAGFNNGNEKVKCNAIPKLDLGLFRKEPVTEPPVEPTTRRPPAPPAGPPAGAPPRPPPPPRTLNSALPDNTADEATDERELEGEIDHLLDLLARMEKKEGHGEK
ncbi:PXDN-like protein, partial [Mya arenaria]